MSACAQSSFHPKKLAPFKMAKKGHSLSDDLDMRKLKVANLFVRDCTCLREVSEGVLSTNRASFEHISIHRQDTRRPENLPELTPKAHLAGFKHN